MHQMNKQHMKKKPNQCKSCVVYSCINLSSVKHRNDTKSLFNILPHTFQESGEGGHSHKVTLTFALLAHYYLIIKYFMHRPLCLKLYYDRLENLILTRRSLVAIST